MTNAFIISSLLCDGLEHLLANLLASRFKLLKCFIGMPRHSVAHCTNRLIIKAAYRPILFIKRLPVGPCSHQCMLENRKLIGPFTYIRKESIKKFLFNFCTGILYRTFNSLPVIFTVHVRNKIVAVIYQLRKSLIVCTFSDKVGTHGYYCENPAFRFFYGAYQFPYKLSSMDPL